MALPVGISFHFCPCPVPKCRGMRTKQEVGRLGEALAAEALRNQGWELLDQNWRGAGGELDIVARDGRDLVAVEVKTRSSLAFGTPAAAITPKKVARMGRLLGQWLAENGKGHRWFGSLRLDAVSVLLPQGPPGAPAPLGDAHGAEPGSNSALPVIEHLRGIS